MTRNLTTAMVIIVAAPAACGQAAEERRVLEADDAYAAAEVRRDETALRRLW